MSQTTKLWTCNRRATVVAEIGNNHEGSFSLAEELIGKAVEAGADVVKFQTFIPELFVNPSDTARLEQLKKFQLTFKEFESLAQTARRADIEFFSTPLDLESAEFLNTIQDIFKIASGDNNFWPLLNKITSFGKPIIASTGLLSQREVLELYDRLSHSLKQHNPDAFIAILHCVSAYPVPPAEANISVVRSLIDLLPHAIVGYSDHTKGPTAAILARAQGARIIEKHFTLDKNFSDFRDHQLSATPDELKNLITQLREAETYLGQADKAAGESERQNHTAMRRSIVAKQDIPEGTALGDSHLTWVRPGNGLEPGSEGVLLGRVALRSFKQGECIHLNDVA